MFIFFVCKLGVSPICLRILLILKRVGFSLTVKAFSYFFLKIGWSGALSLAAALALRAILTTEATPTPLWFGIKSFPQALVRVRERLPQIPSPSGKLLSRSQKMTGRRKLLFPMWKGNYVYFSLSERHARLPSHFKKSKSSHYRSMMLRLAFVKLYSRE